MKKTKTLFKQISEIFIGCVILVSLPLLSMAIGNELKTNENCNLTITDSVFIPSTNYLMDSVRNELIAEVENYVFKTFPTTHKTIPTSIVENALEHEVDIVFMMAQTQIETAFGTTGAGRQTSRRSLFGVAFKKYDSYENAIKDYLRILKKFYLGNGRTEQHLMNNYTTKSGARYAANPKYEIELKNAYKNISNKTTIKSLQNQYKELCMTKEDKY